MIIRDLVRDLARPLVSDEFQSVDAWVTPTDIPAAEADALKAFYEATGGADWTDNTGWGTDATANDWTGVTVSGGHVTAIQLPNNNLIGDAAATLPTTIETLDLGQNTGLTDIDVSGLTSADDIDLAGCDFGQTVVSGILGDIVTAGVSGGVMDIGGSNSAPEPDGVGYLHDLEDDSWTLTYSTVVMENTGDMYGIFADGDATIRSANLDLSGQTGKYIVIQDIAGKYATAYGHAQDDAEAFGTEEVTNGTFTSDALGWTIRQSSVSSASVGGRLELTVVSAQGGVYQNIATTSGGMYKFSCDAIEDTATGILQVGTGENNGSIYQVLRAVGTFSFTTRTITTSTITINLRVSSATVGDVTLFDNVSLTEYTALGTDALQLRNAATGTTRNLTSTETGFDYNNIVKIEVFNA